MERKTTNSSSILTSEEKRLYESTLTKYKDERDAIQKKTFTKWVNKHLKKTNRHVTDLFTDLQDGLNLISLLEVLTGEHLQREKGRMRFHALQNVELVLNFLRYKKIKLVNIRPEDIVDGNPKLTLGLIWTIILHFQISDIVVGEEPNVSAKDVLLRWARKSTHRYPDVKVNDFTSSWRDGLAFNAIIHRNRPDLLNWREVRQRNVRERLETAFYTAEKVGVTRLLDPEDVDTHEIDEKSIITYVSSLFDAFPDPPAVHPLYDNEAQSLTNEYREVASSLHMWIKEKTSFYSERTLPGTLSDLVHLVKECNKFRTIEAPSKMGARQELARLYTDLQKIYESTGEVEIEPELHIDVLERGWNKMMTLHSEREQQLQDEIKKFERLDRLADRLSRDCKRVDSRLDDVESRVKEEAKRLDRIHPLDAKRNADSIESEMRNIEETIQSMNQDLGTLKAVGHQAWPSLDKKVTKLHQKWVSLRSMLHQKLIARLASMSFPVVEERTVTRQTRTVLETRLVDTNHHFRSLQQAIEWCNNKLKQLQDNEYGNDLAGVKIELAHHQRDHKEIDRFQQTVEQCAQAKNQFQGEEQSLYIQHLNTLHKVYSELLTTSNKRLSDLESLLDFLQSLQNQLTWLREKENVEVGRDWSDPNINLANVEAYHDSLMSELEKREVSVRSVIERGNALSLQGHPASKTISRWNELLKETWSRLLQFSLACEVHTLATRKYQEYMRDIREAEAWLQSRDELLNTVYSASEFSLDEGERLLKGMQELREELNSKAAQFAELASRAASVPPIKQRRLPVARPIQITAVCNYNSDSVLIEKDDTWLLHDNSALTHWRVSNLSNRTTDTNVPSVVFLIPPPGKEPLEAAERLNRAFERTTSLWQRKQTRLRQNMIFATIRVVRSWDLAQFIGMGPDQRSAIRRALNEDADKLLAEGDPSDPQLRRLRREMDEVNRLFDEFERRARLEDEQKVALREFTEHANNLQSQLDEFERVLNQRISSSIARDTLTLEHMVLQHKEFETDLKSLTPQIESLQTSYNALPRKTQQLQVKVENILQQWNTIWNYSHLYVERLKCIEIVLASLDEAKNVVSELEIKLVSFGEMPTDLEPLRNVHDDLIRLQNAIAARQPVVDQLIDDATNVRRVVVHSRDRTNEREHVDLDRLDDEVNNVTRRWNELCANLVERLRSCESAFTLLEGFGKTYQTEVKFIDESYTQLNDLPPVSNAKHHIEPTKVLFTSIVERTQPLEQVNIDGGRFIREAKQAMEEKYKLCDDSLRQLLDWITEIEIRLANQEPANEHLDGIRNQINLLKLIKEELDSQTRTVSAAQDDVRTIVTTGAEYLARDEIASVEKSSKILRTKYDRAQATTDRLLRRLGSAAEELNKFRSETQVFSDWLEKAKRLASEKERSVGAGLRQSDVGVVELTSDVIAHQADLRFISMASQKFLDESKEFLMAVNEYRTQLSSRPSLVEPLSGSELRQLVQELTREYKDLLNRVNNLSDRLSSLSVKTKEYKAALDRVRHWMNSAEPAANKILSEPLAADPASLDEQLNRAKVLNTEFSAQSRLFDNLRQTLDTLLRSIEGQASRSEINELSQPVDELTTRYEHIHGALKGRIAALDNALEQSQGVESSLESVISWLSTAENTIKALTRPASLNKNRLDDQIRSLRGPLADIQSHGGQIESVATQARQLVAQATNARLAKRIDTKMKDMLSRYEKLLERATKLNESLAEVNVSLDDFNKRAQDIESWLNEASDGIATGAAQSAIDAIANDREAKRDSIERVLRDGRNLIGRKDVTDTSHVRDRIKNIETQWRELNLLLDEKSRLSKLRAEQSLAYDKLRDQVVQWLNSFEGKISRLEQVALHMDIIRRQTDELKPLVKEHRDYAPTIDRLFDLGSALEALDSRSESPTRRRSSVSPVKRISSLGRRSSQDLTSPSPTKLYASMTSPLSPGSSGFGSRRSSQEAFHLEDGTGVQQEMAEINNRYSMLGVRLSERSAELENVRDELKKVMDHLKTLDAFIERTLRALPRDTLPNTREEADKMNKVVKGLLEEMYEKQSLLDNTKTSVSELLRKKSNAPGSDALAQQLNDVAAKWKNLSDLCKSRIQLLEDLKDLYDTHDHLATWLSAKERMTAALGPISSDPRMVQSQVEQVQVLREELRAMGPQLSHLEDTTSALVSRAKWTPLEAKLKSVQDRWSALAKKLDDRAANLGAAVDSTKEFDLGLSRLRDTLQNISDQIDSATAEKDPEQHLRRLQACERQLEGARQLLADAEAAGEQLCKVLTDAASRADIQAKLAAVNKQYNALQAKLDQRKAEIEGYLRDGREFDATVAKTLGWLSEELGSLSDRLLISADRDILQQQVEAHEPIYKDVLAKEHQIIMLLDKGASQQQKSTEKHLSSRSLDNLRNQWDRLKREAVERQTRLATSMEHCRKYYKALESFVPWLSQAENRLDALRPDSFARRDLDKHLQELAAFRNDLWKKSGEFEHLRSLGETFVASCDIDKDIVVQELSAAKARWDKLNNELLGRISSLEELGRRIADASDRLGAVTSSVQRCEYHLNSHDTLPTHTDAATLSRLSTLRDEVLALRKPLDSLRSTCADLDDEIARVGRGKTSGLSDEVKALSERLDDLTNRLDDRCDRAQVAAKAVQQYNEKVKHLMTDLTGLEDELNSMKPPGRDMKTLRNQQDQLAAFNTKVNRAADDVGAMMALADSLVDSGFSADATRQQAENVSKRLALIEAGSRRREEALEDALERLKDFIGKADEANQLVDAALDEIKHLKPVGSEPETIRNQQEEATRLRRDIIEPAGQSVDVALASGQVLAGTAAPGVSTAAVEKECEKLAEKWASVKERMVERERRLDVGLLQSGKFQEAVEGLSKWLTDTEEMVANQRPPSSDYKVVKAQLQEQKFLKKMLLDRQGSMSSLVAMGREVAANCDAAERAGIERQLRSLAERFEDLSDKAATRMTALEQAMGVAKEFQDKLNPIVDWLDRTEKKIKDMELVPTDEEKIQQKIREHNALHDDILRQKNALSDLTEVASELAGLVGEDEAAAVADKVQEVADRYSNLVEASEGISTLLEAARGRLRHLVVTYQQLQAWMQSMENRLAKYKVLAVHTEQLLAQMEDLADLTEEISNQQGSVDSTVDAGLELMRNISSDEAIQLKDKLDSLQRRYNQLTTKGADLLKQTQEALPLVQQFHHAHNRLADWMHGAETTLQQAEPREESIQALEMDIKEFKPVLENINQLGPQLCAIGPGEGAATIEGLVTRDNRRFDAIAQQIQRKAERLRLCKQRSLEVLGDVDSLLEWFREVEAQLREAEPPSSEPHVIRLQLKEHKALNDDIASQKGRVRDVLDTAKKVLRESPQYEDNSLMRDKMADLRETMDSVWASSGDRLSLLEQALALAQHFDSSHSELVSWLEERENEAKNLRPSMLRPQALMQDQAVTQRLLQSISEHKPLVDKLNKTGEALIKLVQYDEGQKVQEILDSDNQRYTALRNLLKARQEALEKALQESSEFSDKLEGMLRALTNAADEMSSAEPVSAHVPKIKQQLKENKSLVDEIAKREDAFEAIKRAAADVIAKSPSDPAVKDINRKMDKLQQLWNDVNAATKSRNQSLNDALEVAARFWSQLEAVVTALAEIEQSLLNQEPPALRPEEVQAQADQLDNINHEINQTKPRVEEVRKTGAKLMSLVGDPEKPEVRKNIEDLDSAWDTVTSLFAKRRENLIDAMERAMEFHDMLRSLKEFLKTAEARFSALGPLGEDINTIRAQMKEVKDLKAFLDPMMVKVESLNRQAAELTERSSAEQAQGLKEDLSRINSRWDELHRGIAERYRQLENALLRLGQFQQAVSELLAWIAATDRTLDTEMYPIAVDPHQLEIQLAKLKVLMNDMTAHQTSVDTLNDAGRQIIEEGRGKDDSVQDKLKDLNVKWKALLSKATNRQTELEEALRQGHRFSAEVQDLLSWLGEVDSVIAASKPVGGLPETASEQLERFMVVYNELEDSRPRVEGVLSRGNEMLKKSTSTDSTNHLAQSLKTLKTRWESVTARANDKKIKLEIALKEATEFHDALQNFVDWLTSAEKTLSNLKPVSRVLETILSQIEDHKSFQKEVGQHREAMVQLDRQGTHLKYFCQKQDVILIKNLLVSVQHRWERVVSKSAERTRALDHGYKEAKDYHDSWSSMISWLGETDKKLDEISDEITAAANDPAKLKHRLAKHRETQKAIAAKQGQYDTTMRNGKVLRERAPKSDETTLKNMAAQLKDLWNTVCAKAVERQRSLEEALLYCGQVKDALEALLDWLRKTHRELSADSPVHGDLDTVQMLIEQHKNLEQELESRRHQVDSVAKSGRELTAKGDTSGMAGQIHEMSKLWEETVHLAQRRGVKLQGALRQAEELHRAVNMLLEWLSDAEMKLRFVDSLPDDEIETRAQITEHEKFMRELRDKEREKDATVRLAEEILAKAHPDGASVVKHWITIIQSRWEEVTSWARQRRDVLEAQLRALQDMDSLLAELLAWTSEKESTLIGLEHQDLPNEIPPTERLIEEHTFFMEDMAKRTAEVDTVIKAKTIKERKQSTKKVSKDETRQSTTELHEIQRRQSISLRSSKEQLSTLDRRSSRASPTKDAVDSGLPHIGPKFPAKGSKTPEPQFKCARSRMLYDRWRSVWLLSWDRQRRLNEHLAHLRELERLANFSWDDWRKRFLKFNNHKKTRLTDLFRKMDKNNDGLIPRDDFIDGIIKTKFDTNKLEMGAVADMFDHNSEGYIDWKEFIAALRPDWEEKKPVTEADKIHDEVKRLVMLCTCRQKFRVFQVGEGKYRFGDSQKLRLVRILRSTVMVRVGGGWVALEEFLVKNDPCRAKGRTNIELREQFILADNVSQSMSAFKPKLSTERKTPTPTSNTGPITKVREKSSRSVPMTPGSRGSRGSLSDVDTPGTSGTPGGLGTTPRRPSSLRPSSASALGLGGSSLPGSRSNSRPASRQGSKPPSRHGSSLSLASSDDGTPSRIPRRSVPSRTPSSAGASSTSRKLTAPSTVNGSSSPSTRTPKSTSGRSTPKTSR